MIKTFDEDKIARTALKLVREKYDAVKQYCKQFFMKNDCVRMHTESDYLEFGSSEVFLINPDTVSGILVNKIYQRFNISVERRKLYDGVYRIIVEGFIFYTFWSVPKAIFNSLFQKHNKTRVVIPEHSFLMCVYRELYNPANVEQMPDNLKLVKQLHSKAQINSSDLKTGSKDFDQRSLKKCLKDCVFVGYRALKYFLPKIKTAKIYEVISDNVDKLIANIKQLKIPKLDIETQNFPILTDFLFTRTRISVNKQDICYIYNSAEYELIPFFKLKYKTACLYVVARFILINIWIVKFFTHNNKITKPVSKNLVTGFKILHNDLMKNNYKMECIVPGIYNYYGLFVDNRISYKQTKKDGDFNYKPKLMMGLHHRLKHFR